MTETVDEKQRELTGKFKALSFAIRKSTEVMDSTKVEVLTRQISSVTNRIKTVCDLKDEVEEIKFTNGESEEDVQSWAQEIELKITEADSKVSELRERINYIEGNQKSEAQETARAATEVDRQRQLEFEKRKHELKQAAKKKSVSENFNTNRSY